MSMIKTSASRLKASMGKYMRQVRAGREVVITDRGQPVAKLAPIAAPPPPAAVHISMPRDPSAPPLGQLVIRGIPARATDTTAWLREDRDRR
jgi:prevent-host-death family protein